MKRLILFLILCIPFTESYSQKIYITKQTAIKLTKRLDNCRLIEKRLEYTTGQVAELKEEIGKREMEFTKERGKLDSIIAEGEVRVVELERKYEEALKLLSRKKKKIIERRKR